jgi:Tfp pilus assembly protein PilV
MRIRANAVAGITLVEVLVSSVLLATLFGAIFQINAACLRYVSAGKESMAAISNVHDRAEALRNTAFSDLTNADYVKTLLAAPANASEFAQKAPEIVRISAYPTATGVTQLTRSANGSVTVNSTATNLGKSLVQVEVSCTWKGGLAGREQTERAITIVANGTKK